MPHTKNPTEGLHAFFERFDLTEVAPGGEGDEWDGNVGARLLYKMIGWTLRSRAQQK